MADDLVAKILADYPSFAFLINDPDVGPLLLEAVNPEHPLDAATFQAKLLQTNWWKNNNAAARQWQVLLNTDPAQATKMRDERTAQIRQAMGSAGLSFSEDQIAGAVDMSLRLGVDVASPTFKDWMGTWTYQNPAAATNLTGKLKAITEGEYMLHSNDPSLNWWASQIASGRQTEDNFRQSMMRDSQSMYPAFAQRIAAGETPQAIFGSYRSTIAHELELSSPESVDLLHDPRWAKISGVSDGKGGTRALDLSETIGLARAQPEWKMTQGANTQTADLATRVLTDFGATK